MDGFSGTKFECKARGFSMIEVLISIVVLSFGLLGMVGMQAAALKANRDARLQSTAIGMARELADMMRGNRVESVLGTNNPYVGSFSTTMAPTNTSYCLSVGGTCTSTGAIANAEMTEWLARVDEELPGARVKVCFDSAPFDANGLPQWDCTAGAAGAETPVVVKIGWTRGSTDSMNLASVRNSANTAPPSVVLPLTPGNAT